VAAREVSEVVRAGVIDGRPLLAVRNHEGCTEELSADHVIAAPGYRVDIAAMDFLGHELRTELAVSRGTPKLGAGYRSSVPGCTSRGCLRRLRMDL
jgi:FAD-dependent urate hydroxylase